jgi:hypothetical protein
MSDDQKYSEEEFALILRKAAELQASPKAVQRTGGMSLEEMKSIAQEAGIDPALVAAERVLGGTVKHRLEHSVPVALTDERIGALTWVIRSAADHHGKVDANVAGLEWRSVGEPSQTYVTVTKGPDQTNVSGAVDRSGALLLTGVASLAGGIMVGALAFGLVEPESAILATGLVGGGIIGGLVTARAYWKASTRSFRRKVDTIMERVTRALSDSA